MRIAKRLAGISASPTMAVMQEAQEMRARGIDVIDLGPGEPDFPTPEGIKDAAREALDADFTKYTPSAGIRSLRQAIAEKYNREWGADFNADNVIVTAGAKHAIYNVCMAVFEAGDEVLNPAPYWVTFPEAVKLTGAVPVDLLTPEESEFVLEAAAVERACGPSTAGLIVNTPNNPTGAIIPEREVEAIAGIGRRRGLFLLFDETYEYFTYDEARHTSLASFVCGADDFYAIVGSFSKTFSMTGWRVGFAVAHRELIRKITEYQSHQSGSASSISQKAAEAALFSGAEEVGRMKREYERRRKLVIEELGKLPGFRCGRPHGAFYAFPNVQEAMSIAGCSTSEEFSRFLIQEARVATVPGSAFGLEGYIRLSYATSVQNLQEAFARIRQSLAAERTAG